MLGVALTVGLDALDGLGRQAAARLAVLCTGVALLVYFRLVRTVGSMGVASRSYLRTTVGVILGMVVLGERITPPVALDL